MYVVQNGRVNVYITNPDGTSLSLKIVRAGESVTSLLSFTDVLTVSYALSTNFFNSLLNILIASVSFSRYTLVASKDNAILSYVVHFEKDNTILDSPN